MSLQAAASLPPASKMAIVSTWLETLVYGANVIVFSGAVWVLAFQRKQTVAAHRYLLATSVLLFILSTAHIGLSLAQLLQAFIYENPDNAVIYFLNVKNPLMTAKLVLYDTNVYVQDLVLIWRMYAVYGRNRKIAVITFFFECVHIAIAYTATAEAFLVGGLSKEAVKATAATGWVMDLVINIGVTCAIAFKLWRAGRDAASISSNGGGRSAYTGVLLIVVESGAMFAAATFVIVVLWLNTPTQITAVVGIGVVMQLATLSPLLIVVRVGMRNNNVGATEHYNNMHATLSAPRFASNPRAQIEMLQTQETTMELGSNSFVLQDMKGKCLP